MVITTYDLYRGLAGGDVVRGVSHAAARILSSALLIYLRERKASRNATSRPVRYSAMQHSRDTVCPALLGRRAGEPLGWPAALAGLNSVRLPGGARGAFLC